MLLASPLVYSLRARRDFILSLNCIPLSSFLSSTDLLKLGVSRSTVFDYFLVESSFEGSLSDSFSDCVEPYSMAPEEILFGGF